VRALIVLFFLAASILLPDLQIHADNWNPWRGPDGTGASPATDLPLTWSQEENVIWKVAVPGVGSSTPIIWDNKVFVLTAVKKASAGGAATEDGATHVHQFLVVCYDKDSGQKIWDKVVAEEAPHEAGHKDNTFASSSALTDGKHVYADFGSRGIYCLDMDGNVKWSKNLGKMKTRMGFGEGSSPAIFENTLVVPWDNETQSRIVALDASNGEEKWNVDRKERTTWATPLIVEHHGTVQVIANGTSVRSYDLKDGSLIWECGGQVQNPIPSPVLFGDHVIAMTGFRGNKIQSISLDAKGPVTGPPFLAWSRDDAAPYVPSPALYKGTLYFCKQNNATVSSVDAKTGEVLLKPTRISGLDTIYSSPVAAADRIYFTGRDGTTVVIKHAPTLEVLATNTLGEPVDSSLAIVDNRIYIRTSSTLYCIGKK
jgi:outer membrane protein assembly factor BamB